MVKVTFAAAVQMVTACRLSCGSHADSLGRGSIAAWLRQGAPLIAT